MLRYWLAPNFCFKTVWPQATRIGCQKCFSICISWEMSQSFIPCIAALSTGRLWILKKTEIWRLSCNKVPFQVREIALCTTECAWDVSIRYGCDIGIHKFRTSICGPGRHGLSVEPLTVHLVVVVVLSLLKHARGLINQLECTLINDNIGFLGLAKRPKWLEKICIWWLQLGLNTARELPSWDLSLSPAIFISALFLTCSYRSTDGQDTKQR